VEPPKGIYSIVPRICQLPGDKLRLSKNAWEVWAEARDPLVDQHLN